MKMSSTTAMPRMTGVSRLARRRSSMSSFVMIALDDTAVMPAITSASRPPQPTQNPKPMPTAMLIAMRVPPESSSAFALPKNSSWSNSSPRLNSRKISPKVATSSTSAGSKSSGKKWVFGLASSPTSM